MYESTGIGDAHSHAKIDRNIINHLIYGTLETRLCRICLTDDSKEFQSIFDTNYIENGATWSTFRIIKEICQIEFEEELGGVVCRKCADDARRAHELVLQVRAAEDTLQNAAQDLYLHARALAPHHYRGGEMVVLTVGPAGDATVIKREPLENGEMSPPSWDAEPTDRPLVKEEPASSEEGTLRHGAMCHVCGVHLTSDKLLQRHLERHAPSSHACHVCGKLMKTRRTLRLHMAHHEGELGVRAPRRLFVCDYCGQRYIVRQQLEQHIWGKHFDRRPFQCSECGKGFRTMGTLRGHAAVHVGARDHVCGVCRRGFVDARALKQHERLHSGERPYTCATCGRGFVAVNRRNTHAMTAHTPPTRRCPLCPALFHLQSMVNTHVKKVHLRVHKRRRRGFAYRHVVNDDSAV